MHDGIHGFWVAAATPLDSSGTIDAGRLAEHARTLFAQGCDGLVLFGTTGEGTAFTAAERMAAVEALLAQGIPASRLSIGIGFPAIGDTVALGRAALAVGLTQLLALPPYFFRDVSEDGLVDAFSQMIDGIADDRLRLVLYHIPQVSGVAIPPNAVARLRARHGRVLAGLKDSSAEFAQFQAFRAAAPEITLVTGCEPDIGRALAAGGAGTICGMGNVAPALVRAMFTAEAPVAQMRAACGLVSGPFIALLKSMLAAQTGDAGWLHVRAPLRPASMADGRRLLAQLDAVAAKRAA